MPVNPKNPIGPKKKDIEESLKTSEGTTKKSKPPKK